MRFIAPSPLLQGAVDSPGASIQTRALTVLAAQVKPTGGNITDKLQQSAFPDRAIVTKRYVSGVKKTADIKLA